MAARIEDIYLLLIELKNYKGNVLFVRGVIGKEQKTTVKNNIKFYNYLLSYELEIAINESDLILARSGYSTIMDLAVLSKKAFFIPTKGQNEQEYLARRIKKMGIAPYSSVSKFKIEMLDEVKNYIGFNGNTSEIKRELFDLF